MQLEGCVHLLVEPRAEAAQAREVGFVRDVARSRAERVVQVRVQVEEALHQEKGAHAKSTRQNSKGLMRGRPSHTVHGARKGLSRREKRGEGGGLGSAARRYGGRSVAMPSWHGLDCERAHVGVVSVCVLFLVCVGRAWKPQFVMRAKMPAVVTKATFVVVGWRSSVFRPDATWQPRLTWWHRGAHTAHTGGRSQVRRGHRTANGAVPLVFKNNPKRGKEK